MSEGILPEHKNLDSKAFKNNELQLYKEYGKKMAKEKSYHITYLRRRAS